MFYAQKAMQESLGKRKLKEQINKKAYERTAIANTQFEVIEATPLARQFTTTPTRFAYKGDTLLSVMAPVGTLNIAKDDCCIGQGLAALNSKDSCISYLFGVMVNLKQVFDRRNVDGRTFGSITKDDLFSLKVMKPDKSTLAKYHSIINPAFEKHNAINLENQKLSELRDWLLPILMNGQMRVK